MASEPQSTWFYIAQELKIVFLIFKWWGVGGIRIIFLDMWQLYEIPILVFYWNTITLIHLRIICGCFCIKTAELSSRDRDTHTKLMKPKICTTIWSFTEKVCWPLDKIIIWSVHNSGLPENPQVRMTRKVKGRFLGRR